MAEQVQQIKDMEAQLNKPGERRHGLMQKKMNIDKNMEENKTPGCVRMTPH